MPNILLPKKHRNGSWRDKSNPDFDRKKQSVIVDVEDRSPGKRTVQTEAGEVVFDRGIAVMPNDTRAEDVHDELMKKKAKHPDQYALIKNRPGMKRDKTHPMRTINPGVPWAEYDDLGRRIDNA